MNRTRIFAVVAVCVVCVLGAGYFRAVAQQGTHTAAVSDMSASQGTPATNPRTPITGSLKLCSGVFSPSWRDTITVPDTWTSDVCKSYSKSIITPAYQLGCANPDNVSWGKINGGVPADNRCNW
jgi:hypothetical protein